MNTNPACITRPSRSVRAGSQRADPCGRRGGLLAPQQILDTVVPGGPTTLPQAISSPGSRNSADVAESVSLEIGPTVRNHAPSSRPGATGIPVNPRPHPRLLAATSPQAYPRTRAHERPVRPIRVRVRAHTHVHPALARSSRPPRPKRDTRRLRSCDRRVTPRVRDSMWPCHETMKRQASSAGGCVRRDSSDESPSNGGTYLCVGVLTGLSLGYSRTRRGRARERQAQEEVLS